MKFDKSFAKFDIWKNKSLFAFEIGLINALNQIFKNSKYIVCFCHYTRDLQKKIQEICLLANSEFVGIKDWLKYFYLVTFFIIKIKIKLIVYMRDLVK